MKKTQSTTDSTATAGAPPAGAGAPTEDNDGTLHAGGQTITPALKLLLLSFLATRGEVILAPGQPLQPLFLAFQGLLNALSQVDFAGAAGAFGRFLNAFLVVMNLKTLPKVNRRGSPAVAGCVESLHAAAATVQQFPTETANAHQSADTINQQADSLSVFLIVQGSLKSAAELVARNIFPVIKAGVESVRQVVAVVDPIIDTHPEMVPVLNPALHYLKDPHARAAKNNKKNKKEKEALVASTQAQMLPQARDQVRSQVVGQITDALSNALPSDTATKALK